MSEVPAKMTKDDLEKQVGIPEVYKKAIEHAIFEMSISEDPEDKVWPDYFRAEVVSCELNNALNEDDELDDHFYVTEAGWFAAGWKAAPALLEACKAQHDAIDLLFAKLIQLDPDFFPSKSGQPWAALQQGNAAIKKTQGEG